MQTMQKMPYHCGIIFRAYLSTQQQLMANRNIGAARFLYNRLIRWNNELYRMRQAVAYTPAYTDRIKYLEAAVMSPSGMKTAVPFLTEDGIDSMMIENVFQNYRRAWKRYREVPGTGTPSAHKFSYDGSYQTNPHYPKGSQGLNSGNVKLIDTHHIRIPIIGTVRISGSRKYIQFLMDNAADIRFGTITVSVDAVSRYFISVQLGSTVPFTNPMSHTGKTVGIDMNVENFCTDSDGNETGSLKPRRRIQKKLAKTQRIMSRRAMKAKADGRDIRHARNYQKIRKRAALLQYNTSARREYFQHVTAKMYIESNDVIICEDLKIRNLMQNHKLAFAIADQAWNSFFQKLAMKASMYGRTFMQVPARNTTQTCSCCGYILQGNERLTLKDRTWRCPSCGIHHSRDANAANVILQRGIAVLAGQSA